MTLTSSSHKEIPKPQVWQVPNKKHDSHNENYSIILPECIKSSRLSIYNALCKFFFLFFGYQEILSEDLSSLITL